MGLQIFSKRAGWAFFTFLLLLSAACSPTLNWRDTRFPESTIQALLPCEPDRAQRSVPLGGMATDLTMAGCDAGGATFAIMLAKSPAASAGPLLTGWREATVANMKGENVQTRPFLPKGGIALPDSVRISAQGKRADGRTVYAQGVWAAQLVADGASAQLVHMVMYSEKPMPEAADTFFSGLKLP